MKRIQAKVRGKNRQAGIAVLLTMLALMVLSAIGAGLVFMSITETQVNSNYRSEQVAYFAAKAGMEEGRDRMMVTNTNSINTSLPTAAPSAAGGVLYILNEAGATGTVTPWSSTNAYMDDELCHDGYTIAGLTTVSQDLRCTTVPTSTTWYTTVTSTLPWNGTSAALPFKWTRIALKLNGSIQSYPVNSSASLTSLVCWNGSTEVVLTAANCAAMSPAATPVYLVTSLGISSTGARKMVQADVAVTPSSPSGGYGLFATGTGCGAVSLLGGVVTDSWDSAGGGTYAGTKTNTGGSVGSNGNVNMSGGVQVGGNVAASNTTLGSCPDGISVSGGAGMVSGQTPANTYVAMSPALTLPTPPAPNPTPPTTSTSYSGGHAASMVPGTYGNISVSGGASLTLSPGVYNINSLSLSGGATLQISPAGQVTLNVAGASVATPVNFSGGTLSNTTGVPNNFQINYAGTGNISLSGGTGSYLVLDAPNAHANFSGGAAIYGAVVASTITDSGGVNFHVDRSAVVGAIPTTANYLSLSFRHVTY